MRYALILVAIAISQLHCASMKAAQLLNLPSEENQIVAAAVEWDLNDSDVSTRRPVMLLDQTDNWMPQDEIEDLHAYSDEERKQILEQLEERRIPANMRSTNVHKYHLANLALPESVHLYDAIQFDKRYGHRSFQQIVKQFGKEPYVITLSRPYITPDGKATILVHRLATWSGCGGVDILHFRQVGDKWNLDNWDLLVFW